MSCSRVTGICLLTFSMLCFCVFFVASVGTCQVAQLPEIRGVPANWPNLFISPGGHVPYNLGSWISHRGPKASAVGHDRLLEPDGPICMAGDYVSHVVGWQEGAALSVHRAVLQISQMRAA